MATTYTRNLKLRLEDGLSNSARYNLERLDALGGIYLVDAQSNAVIRSAGNIHFRPQDQSVGGSATDTGSVVFGTPDRPLTALTIHSEATSFGDSGSLVGGDSQLQLVGGDLVLNLTNDLEFDLPANYGTTGQVLTTDGVGGLSWSTPSSGAASGYSTSWVTADGTTKSLTHGLGTRACLIQVLDVANDYANISIETITRPTNNTAVLTASESPGTSGWLIVVSAVE